MDGLRGNLSVVGKVLNPTVSQFEISCLVFGFVVQVSEQQE
jgi:hypothetical protein